ARRLRAASALMTGPFHPRSGVGDHEMSLTCGEVPMGSGGMRPARDPPARAEIVHESERTRVTRLFLPGRTVIRKEPLGPDAERRLRHEAAVLVRLRGVAGVVQLAEVPQYPGSIVVVDAGGASLAGLAK